jgi:hypothetical protein
MKKIFVCLGFVLAAILPPATSRAQLFKNLMNNAVNKAAGNAANKATGNTAPATGSGATANGKPDSSGRQRSGYDSASFAQMMARANKPKPSISPADSAAAIKSFMTATGGSGLFYQYRVVYTLKIRNKDSTSRDTTSLAITDGQNIRTDMGMPGAKMALLGHAGLPRYSVWLYPDSRTYVFNIIDTAAINSRDGATYNVTKIGNETVLGYTCIHSKMTIGTPGQKTGVTEDIWTSTGVPGYGTLEKMMTVQNMTPAMMRALEQAGCGGFFVKVQVLSKAVSMDMELITADRRSFPASMFEIPQGYTMGGNMMRSTRLR